MKVIGIKVDEWPGAIDSGVIHQNINTSKAFDCSSGSFRSCLLFTDITIHENQGGRGDERFTVIQRRCNYGVTP
jgi:hypothetical protein